MSSHAFYFGLIVDFFDDKSWSRRGSNHGPLASDSVFVALILDDPTFSHKFFLSNPEVQTYVKLKQKLDYLFIITESKLPKFEFWRTFSLVSEASFVY